MTEKKLKLVYKKIKNCEKTVNNFEYFHENFYGGDVNQNRNFIEGK